MEEKHKEKHNNAQKRTLWIVLILNFSAFILETVFALLDNSRGLLADGLDMLADAFAYGLSLYVIGKSLHKKENVGKAIAFTQLLLLFGGIAQLIFNPYTPKWDTMIWVSAVALLVNSVSLALLLQLHSGDANIRAVVLCSTIDVFANVGVIISAIFVSVFNSLLPDLIISVIIYALVANEIREMFFESRCQCKQGGQIKHTNISIDKK
jgi:Co/Zn/Cd efflux system component